MNDRIFKRNVFLVIGVYCAAIVIGIGLKLLDPTTKDAPVYGTFKDLIPLIVAIPAAWLGYCFQRRQAYLKDVRELWSKLAAAVQDSIQYTHLTSPGQTDYGRVLRTISVTMEELRAVFANVGEAEGKVGLFPFESIKEIHSKVTALGFGAQFEPKEASKVRKEILILWKNLRICFLSELERGVPANVDSWFLSDPGRSPDYSPGPGVIRAPSPSLGRQGN